MSNYYYVMVFITVAMMVTSIIHLFENETLSRRIKNQLIFIASIIIVGAVCEFLGMHLNNVLFCSKYIHGLVKALELTVAPIIPSCYVKIVEERNSGKILNIVINIVIFINAMCELISIFIPFVFFIDENNVYTHGTYYSIYIFSYFIGIAIFILSLLKYTRKYQSRNIATLISMLSFLLMGFSIRLIDSQIHSDWIIVAITYFMFMMYYSDMSLKVDALTHLFNRKSYEYRLKKLDYTTVILILDVNDFKQVNDLYGHQCGDKVLKIIAKSILKVYAKYGYCYRIGGDEFCIILKPGVVEDLLSQNNKMSITAILDGLNEKLDKLLEEQYEEYPMMKKGVSKGYAVFNGLYDVESQNDNKNHYTLSSVKETIKLADERMYEDKKKNKMK